MTEGSYYHSSDRSIPSTGEVIESLGRSYAALVSELLKGYFSGRHVSVDVVIDNKERAMRRTIKVKVEGVFPGEELEAAEFMIRRSLSLAESDRVMMLPAGSPEIFEAHLPSGRAWVFQLLGITGKEAGQLLEWNVYIKNSCKDAHENTSLIIMSLIGDSLRDFVNNYSDPSCAYRYSLITNLSGYLERSRQALSKAAADPRFAVEAANILAMIEVEDPDGRGIKAAADILRNALASRQSGIGGKVLRYNLARLLEETGALKDAEELYRVIFHHDWHFLDVRERLRNLSPLEIASAECAKNLRIICRAVTYWCQNTGALPGALQDLVPAYLSSLPECPVSRKSYEYSRDEGSFKVLCAECRDEERGGVSEKTEPSAEGEIDAPPPTCCQEETDTHRASPHVTDIQESAVQGGSHSFTKEAQEAMIQAHAEAQKMGVSHVGTEHLLLGVIKTVKGNTAGLLRKASVKLSRIRSEAKKRTIGDYEPLVDNVQFTRLAKKAIEEAFNAVYRLDCKDICPEHLLLGILSVRNGIACDILQQCGVDIEAVRAGIHKALRKSTDESCSISVHQKKSEKVKERKLWPVSSIVEWSIVNANRSEYMVVYQEDLFLKISGTDFRNRRALTGRIPGNTLYVYDRDTGKVYYTSIPVMDARSTDLNSKASGFFSKGGLNVSETDITLHCESLSGTEKETIVSPAFESLRPSLYSVNVSNADTEPIVQAPPGYCFKGLLCMSPNNSTVVTFMMQSDRRSKEKDNPRLAFITVSSGKLISVPFEIKEVFPEDIRFSPKYQILSLVPPGDLKIFNFLGKLEHSFSAKSFVQGASFHPFENKVAIGMQGIVIWDVSFGMCKQLVPYGSYPAWSPDGSRIWFRKDDSTLSTVEVKTGKVMGICTIKGAENPGMSLCSKPLFSPNGRYVFCSLSAGSYEVEKTNGNRDVSGASSGSGNRDIFCILDTERKQIWTAQGRTHNILWI